MRDFTAELLKYVKFHGKFTEISRAPQPLFQDAWLMQTKKSVELHIDISEQQIFIVAINVQSQDSRKCLGLEIVK